jgi:dynein assembly factor 3
MEITEAVGFIHLWGFTPACNILSEVEVSNSSLNILISGAGDIRHLLRTLSDLATHDINPTLHFYIQETSKENIARDMLLLYLINEIQLPVRERMELFLDIYGNALMRDRTAEYIDLRARELIKVITDTASTEFYSILDLADLKFKDRDDLEEIFRSWLMSVQFDLASLRDQRLRYHYKERYDVRTNLIDWDYHWYLKELAPQIHFRHYREWRQTGVAFETRLATYTAPNRTLSSYVPGEKVRDILEEITRECIGKRLLGRYSYESLLGLWATS